MTLANPPRIGFRDLLAVPAQSEALNKLNVCRTHRLSEMSAAHGTAMLGGNYSMHLARGKPLSCNEVLMFFSLFFSTSLFAHFNADHGRATWGHNQAFELRGSWQPFAFSMAALFKPSVRKCPGSSINERHVRDAESAWLARFMKYKAS